MEQMDIKNGMDVSSFVLVEESADSEVDSLTCEMCLRDAVMATGDEDDAESCSCDTIEMQAEGLDYDHDHKNEEFDDDGDGSSTDQHRQINWSSSCKIWWADGADDEEEYSSWDIGINNNISRKVKDEMEDRLFWETCMAFGYP